MFVSVSLPVADSEFELMNFPRVPAGKSPRTLSSTLISSFLFTAMVASEHSSRLVLCCEWSQVFGSLLATVSFVPSTLMSLISPIKPIVFHLSPAFVYYSLLVHYFQIRV